MATLIRLFAELSRELRPVIVIALLGLTCVVWVKLSPVPAPGLVLLEGLALLFALVSATYLTAFCIGRHLDTPSRRKGYQDLCNAAWNTPADDAAKDIIIDILSKHHLKEQHFGSCWTFDYVSELFPRYKGQGYIMPAENGIVLGVVTGLPGRWHQSSYVYASGSLDGSVYSINSVIGPLRSWVKAGSKVALELDSNDPVIHGGPFRRLKIRPSSVPPVLERFAGDAASG
ncbi:hypothetical protein ABIC11_004329 [Pseudomonas oryzihabitans]